jgi:hypothetical protein
VNGVNDLELGSEGKEETQIGSLLIAEKELL